MAVANEGRKPGLQLQRADQTIGLQDWAIEILESMRPVCSILDKEALDKPYSAALEEQMVLINNPNKTASARILEGMTQTGQPFSRFALAKSKEHEQYFKQNKLDKTLSDQFDDIAKVSVIKQQDIESQPQIPFDDFLAQYFAQH